MLKPKHNLTLKNFLLNLLIASIAVFMLYKVEDRIFFKEMKDTMLDWVMYWNSDFQAESTQRMAVIEIDDASYRAWGSPVLTPRDKLKALIEQAVKGDARVIAVDINLSWWSDGYIHKSGTPVVSKADLELANYLKTLNDSEYVPIIILTRKYSFNEQNVLVRPPSFLDKILEEEKNVFWSSTFFQVDYDEYRRRWQLASLVCHNRQVTVVPSMQLLVAMAATSSQAAQTIREFKQRLNNWAKTLSCDDINTTIPKLCQAKKCPDLTLKLFKKTVNLAGGRDTERVVYRFAPPDNFQPLTLRLYDKYSALEVLVEGEGQGIDVDNQIVFIGVTHQDSGDIHPIPIRYEYVNGVYLLANAVDTLLRFGQFKLQAWHSKLSIYLSIIIITTVFFYFFNLVPAFLLTTAITFVILFNLSGYAILHGIGVDIALPVFAIQIVEYIWYILNGFINYLKSWRISHE
jgi:CHASE2 domain-containing sensor protein